MMVSLKLRIFLVFVTYLSICRAKLLPTTMFDEQLYLPNEWTSVKNCPVRYYDHGYTHSVLPVGGAPAYEREFAHMAAIGWTAEDGKIDWNCGGSLISENYIVTAGHCVSWHGKAPDVARMGDLNLENDTDNKWAQQITIEEVIPHPLYSPRFRYNDIALLKLSEPITVHDTVCPACLWTNETIRFQFMEACGYGQIGYLESKTPKLLKVTLSPFNFENCTEYYPPDRRLKDGLKDHQMCAADRDHIMDTCLGDSGGPLQIKLLGQGKMNPFLIGITSFGKACGTNAPGVYVRVSSFIDWIESVTSIDTDPRKCAFKYEKYREYEPDVIVDRKDNLEFIDSSKYHIEVSTRYLEYIVEVWGCIGIIVTEKFVLTLASCAILQNTTSDEIKTRDGTEIKIKHVTLHPDYTSGGIDNDIALVELSSEVIFNHNVRPACLYPKSHIPAEYELSIVGLGSEQNLKTPARWKPPVYNDNEARVLVKSRSKPINYTYCNQFYEPEGIKIDEETKICYGNTDYYLVPYSCEIARGAPIERHLYASGTDRYFSYAIGLPTLANDCGFGFPAVASRISYYIDWIDSVIFPGSIKEITSGECVLPSGRSSSCKRASECPHLVQDIRDGKIKLTDYICQFDDSLNDTLVCCPESSRNKGYDFESCPTIHRQYRRVLKGYDTIIGDEFAHLALIGYAQTMEWHCRGNLISDRHVLTSQECFNRTSDYDAVALGNVNSIVYNIARSTSNEKSLTLLTLDKAVSFSPSIIPICLWMDPNKLLFMNTYIVSKINSPLISTEVRPYQTSACRQMTIEGSISSDDQSCVKLIDVPTCTSPGTGIHASRNETGLVIPYLIGQLDNVARVRCNAMNKDAEYTFTRVAPHIDWILAEV